jgi:hypothetical protein
MTFLEHQTSTNTEERSSKELTVQGEMAGYALADAGWRVFRATSRTSRGGKPYNSASFRKFAGVGILSPDSQRDIVALAIPSFLATSIWLRTAFSRRSRSVIITSSHLISVSYHILPRIVQNLRYLTKFTNSW